MRLNKLIEGLEKEREWHTSIAATINTSIYLFRDVKDSTRSGTVEIGFTAEDIVGRIEYLVNAHSAEENIEASQMLNNVLNHILNSVEEEGNYEKELLATMEAATDRVVVAMNLLGEITDEITPSVDEYLALASIHLDDALISMESRMEDIVRAR